MTEVTVGSIKDVLEYDTDEGIRATVLKLSAGVVAVWYKGTDDDGFVKTYPVDVNGIIGTMIDSWEFETTLFVASNWHPSVVKVSGNVFAVAYRGNGSILFVKTMTIGTDGTITKTAIETASFATQVIASHLGGFIKKPGTTKYIAFWDEAGASPPGHMAVISIDDNGTNITLADSWEFDATKGSYPIFIHISGHIFAVTYNDSTNKVIKTLQVADNGTITKSFIHTKTFGSASLPQIIVLVSGSIYAIFSHTSTSGADVKTFNISAIGSIVAVDTGSFWAATVYTVYPLRVLESGGSVYFVYPIRLTGWEGRIVLMPISTMGIIGSVNATSLLISGSCQYGYTPVEVHSGIFVFPWADTPGADGFITTASMVYYATYPPPPPAGTVDLTRVTAIRHIYRPGLFRMEVTLGDVQNAIDMIDTKVRKEVGAPPPKSPYYTSPPFPPPKPPPTYPYFYTPEVEPTYPTYTPPAPPQYTPEVPQPPISYPQYPSYYTPEVPQRPPPVPPIQPSPLDIFKERMWKFMEDPLTQIWETFGRLKWW